MRCPREVPPGGRSEAQLGGQAQHMLMWWEGVADGSLQPPEQQGPCSVLEPGMLILESHEELRKHNQALHDAWYEVVAVPRLWQLQLLRPPLALRHLPPALMPTTRGSRAWLGGARGLAALPRSKARTNASKLQTARSPWL